ncbi:MAG: ACT domain-containing protein [Chloroflexota bacterium]
MAADKIRIGGILQERNLRLVGVMSAADRPGLAAAVFQALAAAQVNVQFIVQCVDLEGDAHMQFCITAEDLPMARGVVERVAAEIGGQMLVRPEPVALVAVFGPDFRQRPGIAGRAFGALAGAGINILAVSTSISTVTSVIADDRFAGSVEALRGVFDMP